MEGRYFRIHHLRRKGVNQFTADTYDAVCMDITQANLGSNRKHVIVKHAKNKMGTVAELIKEVLRNNGITVKSYKKYASTNVKTLFEFDSKEDAAKAQEIVNKMSLPDTVDRDRIKSDGSNVTTNGVKIKVDVKRDANGNITLQEGTNYIPANSTPEAQAAKSSGYTKWIVIGGAALLAIVILLVVLRKKKII